MPIRQIDIAKKLNVSRITVSKALRNHPDISKEMKEKVRQVAEELGYIPNRLAIQLQTNKSYTIGVVVPGIANSFFSLVTHGIIDYATLKGYQTVLTVSRENSQIEIENIKTLLSMRVDGILIAVSEETSDGKIFEQIESFDIPVVFFDRVLDIPQCSSVLVDNRKAACELVEFAIKNGYKRIAHLAGNQIASVGKERLAGYYDALEKYSLPQNPDLVVENGFDAESGYHSFQKLLQQTKLPDVVFAANDRMAQGIYRACSDLNIKIPDDLGVVAFGHKDFAELMHPKLTIIDSPPDQIGQKAIELLISEIENPDAKQSKTVLLETNLLVNDSLITNNKVYSLF
jgi:LacI family transcriptional regulator